MTFPASITPIVLPPGEGRLVPGPAGITVKASAEETNGAIAVLEASGQEPFEGPAHIHHRNDELFYVLDGRFQFVLGPRLVDAWAGSFVFVPRGTVHAPRGLGPGKVLIAFVPGGPEGTFDDIARLVAERGGPVGVEDPAVQAIAQKYHSEFVAMPTDVG